MSQFDFSLPGLGRPPSSRPRKVAEAIKNELTLLLLHKVRDPRLREVSITRVEMTPDLKLARIYFQVTGRTGINAVEQGLKRAKGFFRSGLARGLNLKYTPDLIFRRDPEVENEERLNRLFAKIARRKQDV